MFDELNQNNNKIEDIFSGTEAPVKPDILKPKDPLPAPYAGALPNEMTAVNKKQGMKKILILAIIVVVVIVIIFGIFWILKKVDSSLNVAPVTVDNQQAVPDQALDTPPPSPVDLPVALPQPQDVGLPSVDNFFPPKETVVLDTDQDGLTDEEELLLGTDANNIDTDGDGLFDREEVRVYKTNPLLPDTDGDSYSDGEEVRGGYNPLGTGRLYEITN